MAAPNGKKLLPGGATIPSPSKKDLTKDENDQKNTDNILQPKDKIHEYFNTSFPIKIENETFRLLKDLIQLRRYFHAHPELSYKEINTSKNIAKYLKTLELPVHSNIAETGVTSVLHGLQDGPCILLRADMDALPIQELNDIGYKSTVNNVMHACGHDAHMAILLTVARILSQPKYMKKIHGSVKFCFQPAEEGGAGAKKMIQEGVLDYDPQLKCKPVDQVYGLHVWSYTETGTAVVKHGGLMGGCSTFNIKVKGKGGHGAEPKGTHDAVLASTQLVIQLHSVVSRNLSALDEGVLSIGTLNCGTKGNIIADNGSITGTIRYMSTEVENIFRTRINEIIEGIMKSYNVTITIVYEPDPYPPTINSSKEAVENVKNACLSVIPEGVISTTGATMASEDFSFFLNEKPGCFFFLGAGYNDTHKPKKNEIRPHHKPNFDINEKCLLIGVQIFVNLILDILGKPPKQENLETKNEIQEKIDETKEVVEDKTTQVKENEIDEIKKDDQVEVKEVVGNGIPETATEK